MKRYYSISDEVGNGGDCHFKPGNEGFHAPTIKSSSTFSKLLHSDTKFQTLKKSCQ
jgi:hypothetical protein